MQFRTELTPDKLPVSLQLTDRIVTVGSCFAEVMGQRLADHKLNVLVNPLGTLFSPASISQVLTLALTEQAPAPEGYVQRDGLWFHYDFHSSLWATSQEALAALLHERLQQVGHALRQANWLLLTLGSAVVYRHRETGRVVANCHKMPGTLFEKYLCQIDHVRDDLTRLLRLVRRQNPQLQIVLTVSPVRHVRDGLALNGASKALLRTLCAELPVWHPQTHYFPAYELVQDDLRDYRFYEADLIHPNAQAHDYVFAKFADSAFSPDLCAFVTAWSQIRRAMAHRPLHGPTDAHRQFLQTLLNRFDTLPVTIDTTAERADIEQRLTGL
ncbi:GSCFA domain-containing protein [Fibrella sp. WM1]|uniref:GSCFA domain-containing protein n=1 Tax=Fibrella musci TaxID=3242485 RepID=UPI00351F9807